MTSRQHVLVSAALFFVVAVVGLFLKNSVTVTSGLLGLALVGLAWFAVRSPADPAGECAACGAKPGSPHEWYCDADGQLNG